MNYWQTQALRLVWFGNGLESIAADHLYFEAFQREAETSQKNRIPSPANPFWGTASGRVDGVVNGELQIQPGRLDVILTPNQPGETAGPMMSVDSGMVYYEQIARALSSIGPALRVAAVVEIFKPMPGQTEATSEALRLTGVTQVNDDVVDFSMQLNKQRNFECLPGRKLNRLMRWGVGSFQQFRIEIGGTPEGASFGSVAFVTSVLIDLNNVPAFPLDFEQQMSMYSEISAELVRFAQDPSVERL